ncbi:hypothetical protein [Amphibacillus cookii]|uniref:hypothetical protein n=1 Tax=Amphibacillus cookii TaxID=767787 RepID=UPI001959AF4A|nr:hypothetical protein [Amphibacillus cookii]MBM7542171.1 hypothetical protein [Amphibacillus cookii]
MKKVIWIAVLVISVTTILGIPSLMAEVEEWDPADWDEDKLASFDLGLIDEDDHIEISEDELVIDKSKAIEVEDDNTMSTQSYYSVDGDRMYFTDMLTNDDPDDWWFFTLDEERSFLFELESNQTDYYIQLYLVDWDTGNAYETSVGSTPNRLYAGDHIPEGDWALRVYSNDQLGDAYTIKMNAANPAGAVGLVSRSASLLYAALSYDNGDIYFNGDYIANFSGDNSHLDWERRYHFSWDGNYNQRTHTVSSVKIRNISSPVSYQSQYASSSNALLIYLDIGTLFMHHESYFRSGPPTQYESSFVDTIGLITPRRLDQDDFEHWGDHILVYDTENNETIDFFSVLNYYYASGVERTPTINFLQ